MFRYRPTRRARFSASVARQRAPVSPMRSISAHAALLAPRAVLGKVPVFLLALMIAASAQAGGVFPIDHTVTPTESGIWARKYTLGLQYTVIATEAIGAIWLGGESDLGQTFWQTIDSSVFSGVTAQAMKYVFRRKRPSQSNDPNEWFGSVHDESFPSGEVTLQASFVTPFIVKYADQQPWFWALEALPAYDAVARVKQGGHWQTDVLAGWALGSGFGYWAAHNTSPLFLRVLPHGFMVGLHSKF